LCLLTKNLNLKLFFSLPFNWTISCVLCRAGRLINDVINNNWMRLPAGKMCCDRVIDLTLTANIYGIKHTIKRKFVDFGVWSNFIPLVLDSFITYCIWLRKCLKHTFYICQFLCSLLNDIGLRSVYLGTPRKNWIKRVLSLKPFCKLFMKNSSINKRCHSQNYLVRRMQYFQK